MIYVKMTKQCLESVGKDLATASYDLVGSLVPMEEPGGLEASRHPDLGMMAWYDADPEDPGTFVLINFQYDKPLRRNMAHYVRKEAWDTHKWGRTAQKSEKKGRSPLQGDHCLDEPPHRSGGLDQGTSGDAVRQGYSTGLGGGGTCSRGRNPGGTPRRVRPARGFEPQVRSAGNGPSTKDS